MVRGLSLQNSLTFPKQAFHRQCQEEDNEELKRQQKRHRNNNDDNCDDDDDDNELALCHVLWRT